MGFRGAVRKVLAIGDPSSVDGTWGSAWTGMDLARTRAAYSFDEYGFCTLEEYAWGVRPRSFLKRLQGVPERLGFVEDKYRYEVRWRITRELTSSNTYIEKGVSPGVKNRRPRTWEFHVSTTPGMQVHQVRLAMWETTAEAEVVWNKRGLVDSVLTTNPVAIPSVQTTLVQDSVLNLDMGWPGYRDQFGYQSQPDGRVQSIVRTNNGRDTFTHDLQLSPRGRLKSYSKNGSKPYLFTYMDDNHGNWTLCQADRMLRGGYSGFDFRFRLGFRWLDFPAAPEKRYIEYW